MQHTCVDHDVHVDSHRTGDLVLHSKHSALGRYHRTCALALVTVADAPRPRHPHASMAWDAPCQ